ncbi:unnamed protein product [Alternaria sp. RS040]
MAGKHGIRLPGLLIVPSETEKRFSILWKQPGREQLAATLDFKQHELPDTVMNVPQAREVDVPHHSEQSEQREADKTGTIVQANLPVQEIRNAGGVFTSNENSSTSLTALERIYVTARQVKSVIWNLTVDGDDITPQRLSSVDMSPEVSTQRSLCFTADLEREHHDEGTDSVPSSWCTTEDENLGRGDADLQEQSRKDIYYDAKSHFSEPSGELDVSDDPWEVFARALKRVVKAAGGTFTRLADQK